MPVGEGEVLEEVGEDRGRGFLFFHSKVWFRDCRLLIFGMRLMMSLFCFLFNMFALWVEVSGALFCPFRRAGALKHRLSWLDLGRRKSTWDCTSDEGQ